MELTPLVAISFTLLVSFFFSELAKHYRYPRVLGQVTAGILIGLPFFRLIVNEAALHDIAFLAEIGVIFLFLVIGMEVNLEHLKEEKRRSGIVGALGIMVPLLMGYFVGQWLGYSNLTSLVIGVCLAITSETTNTQVFMEMKLLKKKMAKVLFGAALIDDLFAILFLTFLIPYLNGNVQEVSAIPIKIVAFLWVIWALVKLMPKLVNHINKDESNVAEVSMIVVFGLLIATLSIQLGLGEMVGAFIAGILIQMSSNHKCTEACADLKHQHQKNRRFFLRGTQILRVMTLSFIIPFFFINMGLQLETETILKHPMTMAIILFAAVASKGIGALISKYILPLSWPQTAVIALGMNSRGTLELVIAEVTLTYGIINDEIYAALVIMVLITTLAFPFFLKPLIKKYPRAMN